MGGKKLSSLLLEHKRAPLLECGSGKGEKRTIQIIIPFLIFREVFYRYYSTMFNNVPVES